MKKILLSLATGTQARPRKDAECVTTHRGGLRVPEPPPPIYISQTLTSITKSGQCLSLIQNSRQISYPMGLPRITVKRRKYFSSVSTFNVS